MAFPIRFGAVYGVVKELGKLEDKPLLVTGILADSLADALEVGGDARAIRRGGKPKGAALLLHVIGDSVTQDDEQALKAAHRARVPIVVVAAGRDVPRRVPFVLATDVVRAGPGRGFPVDAIADAIAAKLGEEASSLARRLPPLRRPVVRSLIDAFSRKNGIIGAAVFVPGADLPVLTVNQLRLVLRICAAYGLEVDKERAPEILATVGAGLGFRALAREVLGLVPLAGWLVKGAIAYAGTRALGEATVRYCEARTAMQPQASALPSSS